MKTTILIFLIHIAFVAGFAGYSFDLFSRLRSDLGSSASDNDDGPDNGYKRFQSISKILQDNGDDKETLLQNIVAYGTNFGSFSKRLDGIWRRVPCGAVRQRTDYLKLVRKYTSEDEINAWLDKTEEQVWTKSVNGFFAHSLNNNSLLKTVQGQWINDKFVVISNDPTINSEMEETIEYELCSMPDLSAERVLQVKYRATIPLGVDGSLGIEGVKMREIYFTEIFTRIHKDVCTDNNKMKILVSPVMRVLGCVANVDIQSTLLPTEDNDYILKLDGSADALLSRGLLALMCATLGGDEELERLVAEKSNHYASNSLRASDIMRLDPETIALSLGLRDILSVGRNDGLASMLKTVKIQIESLLDNSKLFTSIDSSPQQTEDVAMLLSGGVDSSVALNLLLEEGYSVRAFYLKIWLEDELSHLGQCPWEDDWAMCQQVCKQAGVHLEAVSLQEEYKQKVISYTVDEASKGRTPNPDIMCNTRVKFGCFYDAIEGRNFKYIATGHYARLRTDENGQKRLVRAPDDIKDQSYFLSALNQEQLSRAMFPIGNYKKSEVRELAQRFDLPNKTRPDSQGLCFLGKVKFDEFLGAYLGERPGNIVDAYNGNVIGRHRGLWFHTVGQRKGIGNYLDPKIVSQGPWYVVAKDPSRNVVLASNQYDEGVFESARTDFYVEDIRWITGKEPASIVSGKGRFQMKIRHGPKITEGLLSLERDGANVIGHIRLDKKDGGLAPGQFVVFYNTKDSECLGSGVISEQHWNILLQNDAKEEYNLT